MQSSVKIASSRARLINVAVFSTATGSQPHFYVCTHTQFRSSRSEVFFSKRCSENMQQIYRRTPITKCDFNKAALQLYWNHTSTGVHIFRTPFTKSISRWLPVTMTTIIFASKYLQYSIFQTFKHFFAKKDKKLTHWVESSCHWKYKFQYACHCDHINPF